MITEALLRAFIEETLDEIIRKSGGKYVLVTKHKKNGKRRRLGTHATKAGAEAQERAIHANGG